MKSFTTTALIAAAAMLTAPTASAGLVTVADYDFEDNANPAGFVNIGGGTPSYAGGQLVLDGASGISLAATPLGVNDNFVMEAIVTASSLVGFDFVISNSVGAANSGNAIFAESGNWGGLQMGITAFGNNIAFSTDTVALAFVRDGGVSTIYVNGVAATTTTGGSATPTQFNIGYNPADGDISGFNGSIDQVRLSTIDGGGFSTGDLLAVPEPGSLALLTLGGLLIARRRRA